MLFRSDALQIFGIAQSCVTLAAVRSGLGHEQDKISSEQFNLFFILIWIGNQFYIAAMACAMLSISLLICRIASARHHLVLGYSIAAIIGVWAFVSLCFLVFECEMPRPWYFHPPATCLSRLNIWMGSSIVNALLEVSNVTTA